MNMKRTDPHRPGAIIPGNYSHILFYHGPISFCGQMLPAFNVDKVLKLRETEKFAKTGKPFKCSVCGAAFNEGEIWKHNETGEHIYLGHQCAEKYGLLADRSEYELEMGRQKQAAAVQVQKALNAEARIEFLSKHPGLEEALKGDHFIIKDIADKFQNRFTSLTDKQIELVFKLAQEKLNPQKAEIKIEAPEGRVTFIGTVVAIKDSWGKFGHQTKMTVKVETAKGVWLAWGTMPLIRDGYPRIRSTEGILSIDKGDKLEVTATLSRGRDPFFALMSRPKAKFIEVAA